MAPRNSKSEKNSIGLNHHFLAVYASKSGFILIQHKTTTEANKPSPPSFVPLKWTVRVRLLNPPINPQHEQFMLLSVCRLLGRFP